jgi:hypothetical protein
MYNLLIYYRIMIIWMVIFNILKQFTSISLCSSETVTGSYIEFVKLNSRSYDLSLLIWTPDFRDMWSQKRENHKLEL